MDLTVPGVPEELKVAGLHSCPAFDPGLLLGHSQNLLPHQFPSVARKVNIISFLCKSPVKRC